MSLYPYILSQPMFVAAAVDFEMINGRRHGDLANKIMEKIITQRRLDVGLDKLPEYLMRVPTRDKSLDEKRRHELQGGIVIVGRHTFKEFMAGLKKGWSSALEKLDREDSLARELADDGLFDERDDPPDVGASSSFDGPGATPSSSSAVYSPLQHIQRQPSPPRPVSQPLPPSVNTPPAVIPPHPPLLLISFTDYVGFSQIPHMLYDFFTQRYKVRAGAESAYRLIMNHTRPFAAPAFPNLDFTDTLKLGEKSDFDFDKKAESYYKPSLASIPANIISARDKYYKSLPEALSTARELARGRRKLTKEEMNDPPKTEVELRAERLKKELRWRGDLEGWEIIKPDADVTWDERFRDVLNVFVDPPPGDVEGESNTE
jgi:import inner membrane translocase subunit TIM54